MAHGKIQCNGQYRMQSPRSMRVLLTDKNVTIDAMNIKVHQFGQHLLTSSKSVNFLLGCSWRVRACVFVFLLLRLLKIVAAAAYVYRKNFVIFCCFLLFRFNTQRFIFQRKSGRMIKIEHVEMNQIEWIRFRFRFAEMYQKAEFCCKTSDGNVFSTGCCCCLSVSKVSPSKRIAITRRHECESRVGVCAISVGNYQLLIGCLMKFISFCLVNASKL